MEHIQYIVKKKTETILFSEKKLRNKNGEYQWSPSFGRELHITDPTENGFSPTPPTQSSQKEY